jgi:hypothetical protein
VQENAKLSTNIDPSPTSPSRKKTMSVDEDQKKAKSPEHIKIYPARELSRPSHGTEQDDATTLPHKPLIDKEGDQEPTLERDREPTMEHLYKTRTRKYSILGRSIDSEPVDEVTNIQEISYVRKRKVCDEKNIQEKEAHAR